MICEFLSVRDALRVSRCSRECQVCCSCSLSRLIPLPEQNFVNASFARLKNLSDYYLPTELQACCLHVSVCSFVSSAVLSLQASPLLTKDVAVRLLRRFPNLEDFSVNFDNILTEQPEVSWFSSSILSVSGLVSILSGLIVVVPFFIPHTQVLEIHKACPKLQKLIATMYRPVPELYQYCTHFKSYQYSALLSAEAIIEAAKHLASIEDINLCTIGRFTPESLAAMQMLVSRCSRVRMFQPEGGEEILPCWQACE